MKMGIFHGEWIHKIAKLVSIRTGSELKVGVHKKIKLVYKDR